MARFRLEKELPWKPMRTTGLWKTKLPAKGMNQACEPLLLIVDDDAVLRESLQVVLEMSGYRVELAHDAEEALTRLKMMHPDLILMDWSLPGISGEDATRQIRSRYPETPVIGLSSEMARAQRMRTAGAAAFIPKPFEMKALVSTIRDIVTAAGH